MGAGIRWPHESSAELIYWNLISRWESFLLRNHRINHQSPFVLLCRIEITTFFFCWWIGRQLWFYAALVEKYATAMHNFTNYFKFVFTVVIDAAAADVVATAVINISYKFGHGFPWLDSTLLLLTSFFFALLFSSFENWADQNNKTTNRVYSATYPGIKTRLIRWCASETNAKLKKIKEAKLEAEN